MRVADVAAHVNTVRTLIGARVNHDHATARFVGHEYFLRLGVVCQAIGILAAVGARDHAKRLLVDDGILETEDDQTHRGRRLYKLTPAGRELWPVLHALLTWGDRHRRPNNRTFHHATCGTRLDEHAACPTCGVTPAPADILAKPRRGVRAHRQDPVGLALRQPRRLLEAIET